MVYIVLTVQVCILEEKSWALDQNTGYSDRSFVGRWQWARSSPEFLYEGATLVTTYRLFLNL